MSVVNLYRNIPITPIMAESPTMLYFTSSTRARLKNATSSRRRCNNNTLAVSSAENFKRHEKVQRYRTYRPSPRTPLYKRFKAIKKRLNFEESPRNIDADEMMKQTAEERQRSDVARALRIPELKITCDEETSNIRSLEKTYIQITVPGVQNSITPNMKRLLINISPLRNHKMLGRGRFGHVVEAVYKGIKVAVKIIHNHHRNFNVLLKNEVNAIGLNHPNIVNTYTMAWSVTNSNFYNNLVIMEHFESAINLQSIIENNVLNSKCIFKYVQHICNALKYLHSNNILHLDVKPKNVLVLPRGTCKLCDFGTSVKFNNLDTQTTFKVNSTVQYCSPELLSGHKPTPASDVYSLGITMWQILHRTMPYGYEMPEEALIYQVVKYNLRPRSLRSLINCLKLLKYCNIYTNCWLRNPVERPTIEIILKLLKENNGLIY